MTDETHANLITDEDTPGSTPKAACPVCQAPAAGDDFPFCSKRCRQIDLGRWLNGSYKITRPIEQSDLEEGE